MKIIVIPKADWQDGLTVTLATAGEETGPGKPGKKAGGVQLVGESQAVASLGIAKKQDNEATRVAGGGLAKWFKTYEVKKAGIELGGLGELDVSGLVEGLMLGGYSFDKHKTKKKETVDTEVHLLAEGDTALLQAEVDRAVTICRGTITARDIGAEPPNVINPVTLAERCEGIAKAWGLKIKVYDDNELSEMGAGAIVSVGKASKTPSRLIVMEYPGNGEGDPVVVVGKAITFDTGGYSLKTVTGMVGMKYDKCGGAAVAGIMETIGALKPDVPVVGIIAAAENMVNEDAYRPNDIVTSLSGKTIEIISTDAEGRMVLSDALTFAQKNFSPRVVIDMATLTGGVITTLGNYRAGIMGTDQELIDALKTAGEATHERLWQLPLDDDYFELIKGTHSDMKNSGGSAKASPIVGGIFLKQFIEKGTKWVHLDVAGTAMLSQPLSSYVPAGASGFGVRLIMKYLEGLK